MDAEDALLVATALLVSGRTRRATEEATQLRSSLMRALATRLTNAGDEEEAVTQDEERDKGKEDKEDGGGESEDEYTEEDEDSTTSDTPAEGEAYVEGIAYDGLSEDELAWTKRLAKWLRCFTKASIKWAIVKDTEEEDKKVHCLVVMLTVDVTAWKYDGSAKPVKLLRLREAIDLIRLVALARPAVLKALIRRLEAYQPSTVPKISAAEDELHALIRGVPVEVHIELYHEGIKPVGLTERIARYFLLKLSVTPFSNDTFMKTWADLLALVVEKHGLVPSNRLLTAPLRVSVSIDSMVTAGGAEWASLRFFNELIKFARAAHASQQAQETKSWALDGRFAQLHVEQIELNLRTMYLTSKVCRLVESLMLTSSDISVTCARLSLDPRFLVDDRSVVQSYVKAFAMKDKIVSTRIPLSSLSADPRGEDHSQVIRLVMEGMATASEAGLVEIGGLLTVYDEAHNRDAIWCGLFDFVLSREPPIADLALIRDVQLTSEDAASIKKYASSWRQNNPHKKVCLEQLHLVIEDTTPSSIITLLDAFDDVQRIAIHFSLLRPPLPSEVLVSVLRFPSLNQLRFENVVVESMDVFDPSIHDHRLPKKPFLQVLDLRDVIVQDTASLQRFIAKLAPNPLHPHALSSTLRQFILNQKNRTFENRAIFDKAMVSALHAALLKNTTLHNVGICVDADEELADETQKQFKAQNGRLLKARPKLWLSEIAKARRLAFLSVIHHTNDRAEAFHHLDSSVVKMILEFSGPHEYRKVEVEKAHFQRDDEDEDDEDDEDEEDDEDDEEEED